MSRERRADERTAARKLVCITRLDASAGDYDRVAMYELVDLSASGMRVRTASVPFQADERTEVDLDVDGDSFELVARVVHTCDDEAGFAFVDLDDEVRTRLELFVIAAGWAL